MSVRTGEDYIRSLRDGRKIWYAGQRIEDVTAHPGFTGAIKTLARLYDLQHRPGSAELMTVEWMGHRISYSYLPPQTPEELAAKRRNTEIWSQETLGYMGRLPDFCANLLVGLRAISGELEKHDPRFARNAIRYHQFCAERDLCLTHALNDQYYDRSKRVLEQSNPDLILRVVKETPEGPVVRGLRNLATLAPLSDEVIVYPNRPREQDEADYALAFAVPMNTPGLKIICRDLYGWNAHPDRLPLSARFDEVDATLIFDDVLIPWDRVFVYREPSLTNRLLDMINRPWAGYASMVRLLSKLEAFVGVAELLTQWDGRGKNKPAQAMIGQLITDVEVLRACIRIAEMDAYRTPSGFLAPRASEAFRLHGIDASDRAERLLEDLLTSSLILTGGESDLADAEIGPHIEKLFRNNAPSTREHLRLLAVASDMLQSAFGGRQQLYERLHMGPLEVTRQRLYAKTDRSVVVERMLRFIRERFD